MRENCLVQMDLTDETGHAHSIGGFQCAYGLRYIAGRNAELYKNLLGKQ